MRVSIYAALALIGAAMCPLSAHAQVAQEPNYQLDYKLNLLTIPYNGGGAATFDSTGVPYSVDNSALFKTGSFTRVAYEWTLSGSTDPTYSPNGNLWVSFVAQSNVASQLGVPATATGEYYNQSVSDMNVITTLPGLSGRGISDGTIQFWPTNYGTNSNGDFDWNNCCGGLGGGYGHMEVGETNFVADPSGNTGQVLGAFDNWGGNGGAVDVGIGDRPGGGYQVTGIGTDYTFAHNAFNYTSAVLTVWVVPEPSSFVLAGLGAIGLFVAARRRRKA